MRKNTVATAPGKPSKDIPFTASEETARDAEEAQEVINKVARDQTKQEKANVKSAAKTRIKAKLKINDSDLEDLKKVLS